MVLVLSTCSFDEIGLSSCVSSAELRLAGPNASYHGWWSHDVSVKPDCLLDPRIAKILVLTPRCEATRGRFTMSRLLVRGHV